MAASAYSGPHYSTTRRLLQGQKRYELSNHLGNVLVTINDRRVPRDGAAIDYVAEFCVTLTPTHSLTPNWGCRGVHLHHLPSPEGFYVEKLDLKGKSLWVATEKFSAKEVANMSNVAGTNRISIEQGIVPGEIAISFKTATNKLAGWKYNLVYKVFDSHGKLLRSSLIQEKTVVDLSEDKIKLTEKNVDELTSPTNPELQKAHRVYLLKHGCKNRLSPVWYHNAALESIAADQKGVFQFVKIVAE